MIYQYNKAILTIYYLDLMTDDASPYTLKADDPTNDLVDADEQSSTRSSLVSNGESGDKPRIGNANDTDTANTDTDIANKESVANKDTDVDTGTESSTDNMNDDSPKATPVNPLTQGDGNGIAMHPEAEITITSEGPDVVVAEISAPDTDTTTVYADDQSSQDPVPATHDSSFTDHVPAPQLTDLDDNGKSAGIAAATSTEDSAQTTDRQTTDRQTTDAQADEDQEDKEQEEREAKLESYKQFVAHQESNREIDYPQVRVSIEANALPSKTYFLMNALSAIIASYGLIANSAAVVIGAMLVAMMLGPITGVALAIIDYRMPLLRKSLLTVAAGGLLVVGIGFLVGLLHHGQPLTNEILSRTQPTSMDLMIALAGGTAGAYAMISPHLSVAVVGVAVATALVPPLAASGILFANGEISLGLGAFLLAVTNIIAIQFTNAMVLWFTGFRRLVDDDYKSGTYLTFFRRNAVTLLMLVGLGVYLSINLNTIAKQQKFETDVKAAINDHFIDKGNVLTNTQFEKHNGYQTIRAVVRGETDPSPYDVQQIEAVITQDIEKNYPNYLPVKLQLRYLPIQVIESNPLIKDKLDETDAAILTN